VATARQLLDLTVAHVLDHLAQARVRPEEVLAVVGAVLDREGLERAVGVLFIWLTRTPSTSRASSSSHSRPQIDLDDVPAGAAEVRLQLLDDLAVAADRTVELLQVAVDDPGEVVELLAAARPIAPSDSGSPISPSPRNAHTCCSLVSLMPRFCR
jgi:hypothetical protein